MRLSLPFLALLAGALLVGCGGGEDYSDATTTGQPGAAAGQPPAEPALPEPQKASPIVAELQGAYDAISKMGDPKGQQEQARATAERYATQAVPNDGLYFRGLLWQLAADHAKAAADFAQFADTCPDDRNHKWGLFRAGECYAQSGEVELALKYVDLMSERYPGEAKYVKALTGKVGMGMLAEGRFAEAASLLTRAARAGDAYAGQEAVQCLWAAGKYDEARELAGQLKDSHEGGPEQERYDALAARAQKLGKPAPELVVEGWAGDAAEMEGSVRIIYFWNLRNRSNAVKTEKALKPIYDKYASEGLRICGLSKHIQFDLVKNEEDPSMGPEEELKNLVNWIYNYETPWAVGLCADDALHDAFGYWKLPSLAIVDQKGVYRYFRSGAGDEDWAAIDAVVGKLLAE